MKMTMKILPLALAAMLLVPSCGPGTNARKVRVAIDWGNTGAGLTTKVIPSTATRLTLRVSGHDISTQEQSINRTLTHATSQPTAAPTATPAPPAAGTSLGGDLTLPPGDTGPVDIAVSSAGHIWTANNGTNTVTKFAFPSFTASSFASGGNGPTEIASDSQDNAVILNSTSNQLHKIDNNGNTVAGYPVTITAGNTRGLAVDSLNNAYVVAGTSTILKFNAAGTQVGSQAVGTGAQDVAVDASDNVWVTDFSGNAVFRLNGNLTTTLGPITVTTPSRIAVDNAGNAWVTSNNGTSVTRIPAGSTTAGTPITLPGGGLPRKIVTDTNGNAWVTVGTATGGQVFSIAPAGTVSGPFSVGNNPNGLAIDRNRANLYTANQSAATVSRISTGGPLGLRYQQLTPSPSPSPTPVVSFPPLPVPRNLFDATSQVVVLEFNVPIGNSRLAEATAFDTAGQALVCGRTFFNVFSDGPDPQVEINLSTQGCQASPTPTP